MQFKVVVRVVGVLLSLFSVTMFVPILVSLFYRDGATLPFVYAFLVTLATGLCCWLPLRNEPMRLRLRDNFVVVVMFWTVLGLFGALPLYLYSPMSLTLGQSIFESMSGFTTTGATVIVELDKQPESILFYRQFVQWLGGMGIVVLAVAILPLMGFVGGTQLFRAETSGPQTDKMTPRIGETAKVLWYIYFGLTVACALAYWIAGMSVFDAVGHSFSTVAIGGFSTHDASIGYFQSTAIEMIAVVFMLISAISFTLHYLALRDVVFKHERLDSISRKRWQMPSRDDLPDLREFTIKPYRTDPEFKAFVLLIFALCTVVVAYLYLTDTASFEKSFYHGVFQVVSIATTTGFTTAEYFNWPGFLPVLLLFASFVGGCAGSTGGGMKVIRVLLLFKQGVRELVRMVHPNATIPVKLGKKVVPSRTIDSVWGFFAAYVVILALMLLALMATGLDQETAFSAVVACLNNLGPGLGDVGANYSSLDSGQLIVLCVAMLLGRLEIFTLLVILTPHFWRK